MTIIPQVFRELELGAEMHQTLVWFMAMPYDIGRFHSFEIVTKCIKSLVPEPKTLGELAKQYSAGTLFEADEETYQLVGFMADGIAVRVLNSELVISIPSETKVRRIF
jgi:hypothetical protein